MTEPPLSEYLIRSGRSGEPVSRLRGGYDGDLWRADDLVIRADRRDINDVRWVLDLVSELHRNGAPVPPVTTEGILDLDGFVFSVGEYVQIVTEPANPVRLIEAVGVTQQAARQVVVPARTKKRAGAVEYPTDGSLGSWWHHWNSQQPLGVIHGDLHPGNVWNTSFGPVIGDWWESGPGSLRFDAATLAFELNRRADRVDSRSADALFAIYTSVADEPDPLPREMAGLNACWLWRRLQWATIPGTDSYRHRAVLESCFRSALIEAGLA